MPNEYADLLDCIERNGITQSDGAIEVPDELRFVVLFPCRQQPSFKNPAETAYVRFTPDVGTPEYFAAECWRMSSDYVRKDDGRHVRRFPAGAVEALRRAVEVSDGSDRHTQYVTLSQLALVSRVGKRTLEDAKRNGLIPPPDVPATTKGKAHLWRYDSVRSSLQSLSKRPLPVCYPDLFEKM